MKLGKLDIYIYLVSGEKFEPTNQNPNFSIINWLFSEIIQLFLKFLLEIENLIENRPDISLKFFLYFSRFIYN
jgi:hypothetical protein